MIRLAARPLLSPLTVSDATTAEVTLWPASIFTPLKRQAIGKVWRLTWAGLTSSFGTGGIGGGPPDVSGALNFYYGSVAPANLLFTSTINVNGGSPGGQPLFVIQPDGYIAISSPYNTLQVPVDLSHDSAIVVTVVPSAATAGETFTTTLILFEELEFDEVTFGRA